MTTTRRGMTEEAADAAIDQACRMLFYIEMPLIAGRDLATVLVDEGPLPLARAAEIIRQIADALDVAHEAGMGAPRCQTIGVVDSEEMGRGGGRRRAGWSGFRHRCPSGCRIARKSSHNSSAARSATGVSETVLKKPCGNDG